MSPVRQTISGIGMRRSSILVFGGNFVAFLLASAGAFQPQNNMLLIGMDGEVTRTTTMLVSRFATLPLGLPAAQFESLGTFLVFNPLLSPSLLPLILLGERAGVWVGFIVCASLLFVSAYLVGRALGFGRGVSLLAAWALPLLSLPYQSWINLYLSFNLNPIAGDTVSAAMLAVACVAWGYRSRRVYGGALGLTLIVLWLFLANPLWILLVLPGVIPIGVGLIASHLRERGALVRTTALLLPSILFVALGGAPYLIGLFTDTAVRFFPHELNADMVRLLRLVTVATANGPGLDPIGASWIGLALLGIVLAIRRGGNGLRVAALSTLAALLIFAAYSAAYLILPSWVAPYPVYYEFFLWPYYALFAAYAIGVITATPSGFVHRYFRRLSSAIARFSQARWRYVGSWVALGALLAILMARNPFNVGSDLYLPPVSTAASMAMSPVIGLVAGAPFRGYVATLTGFGGPAGPTADWLTLQPEANESFLKFGNTDRAPYLWRFGLATLEGYSETIEPAVYAIVTRLLDRPGDRQIRNIILTSRVNIGLMESLGIRYFITDFQVPAPARLVAQQIAPSVSHFTYELPEPNTGGYSPTHVVNVANATELLRQLAESNFDFRKTVILDEPLELNLEPAVSGELTVVPGGWRIRARSEGTSLVLLPVQFSNCLDSSSNIASGGHVLGLKRANLAGTALVFQGTIDVTLRLNVSPFVKPYCRIEDAQAMKAFGLAELPRNTHAGPTNAEASGKPTARTGN
jgi:hypothetical protein